MAPHPDARQRGNEPPEAGGRHLTWALGAYAVAVLYYASLFDRRWIPFDEGTLGQSAVRVLEGQLPHRDFDAVYTGLLEYLHAAAMAVMGVHLLAPRLVMFIAILLWVPALFSLAHRLVGSAPVAAALTVLAMIVGPPNYPAAMPSWYNLFFATWGLWALVRWSDGRRVGWLLLAGGCGGVSMLFKVTGIYFVAGALFAVLHLEVDRRRGASGTARRHGAGPVPLATAAVVLLLVLMETRLVWPQMRVATWVNYVLPTVLLGGVLVWRASLSRTDGGVIGRVAAAWALLMLGVGVALAPFLGWFAAEGAVDDLYRGVFLLPFDRISGAAAQVPSLTLSWGTLLVVGLLVAERGAARGVRAVLAAIVLMIGAWLMIRMDLDIYVVLFSALLVLVPVVTAAGAAHLAGESASPRRRALIATLWVLALINLVRYPFAGPIYFTYVAPLGVLAVAGVLAAVGARKVEPLRPWLPRRPVLAAVGVTFAVFFLLAPNRGGLFGPLPPVPEVPLPLERGRIDVPFTEAVEYVRLVEAIGERTRSRYVYATPDAPEVYFLSGLDNPTRTLFEIFDEGGSETARIMRVLEEHDVNVVVVNTAPHFSSMPPELLEELGRIFPREEGIGRFVVRWREGPG